MTHLATADKLTGRQKRILAFMVDYHDDHGIWPTLREIAAALDINSTSVVNYNLSALQRKGYVKRHPFVSRGSRVALDEPEEGWTATVMTDHGEIVTGVVLAATE